MRQCAIGLYPPDGDGNVRGVADSLATTERCDPMTMKFAAGVAAALFALPAAAQDFTGDPETGAQLFERQCITCHVIATPDGETIAGRNARVGPNLWNVTGRVAGAVDGFRYGDGIETANEMGIEWTEENFVGYVQDPTNWLREAVDNRRVRGKMTWRVRSEEEAHDLYAYLATVGSEGGES